MASAEVELFKSDDTKLVLSGTFIGAGFVNPGTWFGESESFLGGDTESWSEFGTEFGLGFEHTSGKSTVFAALSGLYTSTGHNDASGLTIGLHKTSQADVEQAHIGWKLDDPFEGLEDDSFTLSVGRQDYLIGSGLLIADGHSDGGERGGWYIGMRKAFQETVIASLDSRSLLVEGFHLKNTPRRGGTQGTADGANLEYTFASSLTVGATYMLVDPETADTDSLNVWSWRVDWQGLSGLELAGEYVVEDSDEVDSRAWFAQIGWSFTDSAWLPWIGYRYAAFDGDNPHTVKNENFRSVAYGYTDYGSWFQGEISGNYPLGNGNLISSLFRLKVQPTDSLSMNLMYYIFTFDQPSALSPDVTHDKWGDEINFTVDWAVTGEWYLIGVLGELFPGDAAEQWTGGDDDWLYSMLYVSYSF